MIILYYFIDPLFIVKDLSVHAKRPTATETPTHDTGQVPAARVFTLTHKWPAGVPSTRVLFTALFPSANILIGKNFTISK